MTDGSRITEIFKKEGLRGVAREMNVTEEKAKQKVTDQGLTTLNSMDPTDLSMEESLRIRDIDKKKIQGLIGEFIVNNSTHALEEVVDRRIPGDWIIVDEANIVGSTGGVSTPGLRRFHDPKIKGKTVKHQGTPREKIEEQIKEHTYRLSTDLMSHFRDSFYPSVDFFKIAFKPTNNQEKIKFRLADPSTEKIGAKPIQIKVPEAEDFKLFYFEVKTSKDKANSLLSKTQREARDFAKESPFADFYTVRVDLDMGEIKMPDEFNLDVRGHS